MDGNEHPYHRTIGRAADALFVIQSVCDLCGFKIEVRVSEEALEEAERAHSADCPERIHALPHSA